MTATTALRLSNHISRPALARGFGMGEPRASALRLMVLLACGLLVSTASAGEPKELDGLPLVFSEDFEDGAGAWQPTDAAAWRIEEVDGGHVYSQFKKRSKYEPPHRSPYNIALRKGVYVGDFILTARVKSTIPDYNHRDACLFFGYQNPAHFYYVHLGKRTDDHANQIFIVDDAPRTKISTKTTEGTNWDDAWHNVKIVRRVESGKIEIYFDNMDEPIMTATNDRFRWGRVGIGTFDDTSQWDDVRLYGTKVEPPKD